MKLEEILKTYRHEYKADCDICELTQTVLTKESNYPEYETQVYLQCQCGNYLEFILPVN